jgi:hypothetical protein
VFAVLVAVCAFLVIRRRHRQEAQHKAGPPAALEKSGGPSSIIGAGDKFPGAGAAWAAHQAPAQLRDAQPPPTYAVSLPPPSASTGAGQGDSFPGYAQLASFGSQPGSGSSGSAIKPTTPPPGQQSDALLSWVNSQLPLVQAREIAGEPLLSEAALLPASTEGLARRSSQQLVDIGAWKLNFADLDITRPLGE